MLLKVIILGDSGYVNCFNFPVSFWLAEKSADDLFSFVCLSIFSNFCDLCICLRVMGDCYSDLLSLFTVWVAIIFDYFCFF